VDLSITNIVVFLSLSLFLLLFFFSALRGKMAYIPRPWQSFLEIIYLFVFSLVVEQAGIKGRFFFPALFTLFSLILTFNLLGLLPFSFTLSAHIIITLSLSLTFFLAWIIVGLIKLRFKFLFIFFPKNIPLWLMPLLVLVEILSFFLRPLSLAIRLFANMLAGHILLHIVAASVLFLLNKFFFLFLLPFIFVTFIYVLEIGICFLQAYIFTILLCIYLHDSLYSH
jgi:F-type H+-transporting ATPase subunit a